MRYMLALWLISVGCGAYLLMTGLATDDDDQVDKGFHILILDAFAICLIVAVAVLSFGGAE